MAILCAERVICSSSTVSSSYGYSSNHKVAVAGTSMVSMVGHRNVSAKLRVALTGAKRRSSSSLLECRSSVKPLSDSNGNVVEFETEEEFNKILEEAGDKLVVVDISTRTCGPCKMIFPKIVEMSLDYPDAVFLKINGDTNNDTRTLMRKWGVRAVPNFRFYKNGENVHSHTGAKLEELKKRFAEHYGSPIKV